MASNIDYLRKVPLLRDLTRDALEAIGDVCHRRSLTAEETLFLENEPGGAVYVVVGGRVRIERVTKEGKGQVIGFRGPGEVIGEMSLLDGLPRSATATAATPVKLLGLYQEDFRRAVLAHPQACFAVMKSLSMRLREAADQVVDHLTKEVSERLMEHLRNLADDDGVARGIGTQTMVAEVLGCARETVSRAFTELEAEGRVRRYGRKEVRILKA